MAFPVGFVPPADPTFEQLAAGAAAPPARTEIRLRLVDGQSGWVDVLRLGGRGAPDEFTVRDQAGGVLHAAADDLAEVIECATGVHYGRAERLADQARRDLG